MRVLTGCLMQESNSFSPARGTLDTFRAGALIEGAASVEEFVGKGTEVSGFAEVARRESVTLVPTLTAWASSAGPMIGRDFASLVDRFLALARPQLPVDGVLIALHGAWVAESDDDADGLVLARLRDLVGPDVPIVATLDIHANVTRRMVDSASALVGYQTYPHVDMRETGERAAKLLFRALRGEASPRMAYRKVPMILPPENSQTTEGAMADLEGQARALERMPSILSASLFPVQPWLDVAEMGASALVVADGDGALAQREADRLAGAFWSRRREFAVPLVAPAEAVARALAAPEGPVLLIDSADGTSSGAPGDSTALLHPLFAAASDRMTLVTVVDAEAARSAAAAGVGAEVTLDIGGRLDPARHRPARARGAVERVSDGRFTFGAGVGSGLTADMGTTVVLRVGGVRAVIMTNAVPCYDPALYRSVGLEPLAAQAVVVKSPTNFRWTYRDIAREAIYVDAPGASSPRIDALPFSRVPRPIYPLDDVDWRAPSK